MTEKSPELGSNPEVLQNSITLSDRGSERFTPKIFFPKFHEMASNIVLFGVSFSALAPLALYAYLQVSPNDVITMMRSGVISTTVVAIVAGVVYEKISQASS